MLKLENFRESIPYMIKTIEELKTRDFLDISDKCDKLIEILNEAKKDKTFDIIEPLILISEELYKEAVENKNQNCENLLFEISNIFLCYNKPLNFREVEHSDYNLKRIINIIKSFRR